MAQVWDGTTNDRLSATGSLSLSINTGQSFSACGWATSTTSSLKALFVVSDNTNSGDVRQLSLTHQSGSANLTFYGYGTAQLFPNIAVVDDGSWFFWAITASGIAIGSATFYVFRPGTGWTSNTNTVALQAVPSATVISIGNNGSTGVVGAEPWVGRTQNFKAWRSALTQQEVFSEMASLMPTRTNGLYLAMPGLGLSTADAFRDLAGLAWTLTGTITYNDTHPAVPYGRGAMLAQPPSVTYSFARPTADITTGWTTSSGTSHFALIDEETASDADYIYATAASQTDEVRLAALTSPQGDIAINYRVTGITGGGKVTVSMYQGTTLIKSDTQRTSNGDYTLTVTAAEHAGVTSWSDIRLRFVSG